MSTSTLVECDVCKLTESHTNLHQLSWENKYHVSTTEPDPDMSSYPHTRACDSSAYHQFQPAWLKQYPWLHYSKYVDGVYCHALGSFLAPDHVKGQDPGQFVTKPFTSWIKMSQKATAHAKHDYHLNSMTKMTEFLARYENPALAISSIIDSESQKNHGEQ